MISNLKNIAFVTSGLLLVTKYSTGRGSETERKRMGESVTTGQWWYWQNVFFYYSVP